jgi:hypothetical protein
MSMGVRFGLPAAAALGPRPQCAVLGKFSVRQAAPPHPRLCAPSLMTTAARAISAALLYHVQWDDEIFPHAQHATREPLMTMTATRVPRQVTYAPL